MVLESSGYLQGCKISKVHRVKGHRKVFFSGKRSTCAVRTCYLTQGRKSEGWEEWR